MQAAPADPPSTPRRYRGRFAPTPSGPLHFGSVVTALASFLDARTRGGEWLLRIDDLDRTRCRADAERRILTTLERLGLAWDGPVVRQRDRRDAYAEAVTRLRAAGLVYPCGCSRSDYAGGPYPGTCRDGLPRGRRPRALRVRCAGAVITARDRLRPALTQDLEREIGDFVVVRADGFHAYHLAVVVDDAWQGVTDVVRGADLHASTPRQIHLQRLLGLPTPRYAHVPLVRDADGRKLSKQTRAHPVDGEPPAAVLRRALAFLGHPPPADVVDVPDLIAWGVRSWRIERIPREREPHPGAPS